MPDHLQEDIQVLIRMIEQKGNWGDAAQWSVHEFEALREQILEVTGEALSVTTLKRIWGKARQDNAPSKTTLNILARFAGFENWHHFRMEQQHEATPPRPTGGRKKKWVMAALLLLAPLVLFTLSNHFFGADTLSSADIERIVFEAGITSDSFPRRVAFTYDLGELDHTDFAIRPGVKAEKNIPLPHTAGHIADTYYYPGYYRAQLLHCEIPLKEEMIPVATNGWEVLLNRSSLNFPIYLPPQDQVRQDMIQSLDPDDFLLLNKSQDYINVQLSNLSSTPLIDGNNFSFSSRFRLSRAFDNSPCKVITVILHSSNGAIRFGFAIPGCTGDMNFDLLGEKISGNTVDLSRFGVDPIEWINLKVLHQDQQLTISANDVQVLEYAHQKDIGQIGGVSFVFDGLGEVEQASLNDLRQEVVLF